jgi:hypothetical protein
MDRDRGIIERAFPTGERREPGRDRPTSGIHQPKPIGISQSQISRDRHADGERLPCRSDIEGVVDPDRHIESSRSKWSCGKRFLSRRLGDVRC